MVYSVDVYDKVWKIVSKIDLNKETFSDDKVNKALIHEYFLLQQSNSRNVIAHTKWRWDVAGSGKKLYRQKGTWNARVWDRRSPIRVGWGISRWPKNVANFKKSMNKKARRIAMNSLITLKAKSKDIFGLKEFDMKEPKTKEAQSVIDSMKLSGSKVLVVLWEKNENIQKSFRNLPTAKYLLVDYLNPVDLMSYSKVVFFESALNKINQD